MGRDNKRSRCGVGSSHHGCIRLSDARADEEYGRMMDEMNEA